MIYHLSPIFKISAKFYEIFEIYEIELRASLTNGMIDLNIWDIITEERLRIYVRSVA